jgi:hypothetical protein
VVRSHTGGLRLRGRLRANDAAWIRRTPQVRGRDGRRGFRARQRPVHRGDEGDERYGQTRWARTSTSTGPVDIAPVSSRSSGFRHGGRPLRAGRLCRLDAAGHEHDRRNPAYCSLPGEGGSTFLAAHVYYGDGRASSPRSRRQQDEVSCRSPMGARMLPCDVGDQYAQERLTWGRCEGPRGLREHHADDLQRAAERGRVRLPDGCPGCARLVSRRSRDGPPRRRTARRRRAFRPS